MAGGRCSGLSELPDNALAIVSESRRAVLATIGAGAQPHLVPICFALRGHAVVSAIDHKPKRSSRLARVANIRRDPRATLMLDRWSEDWTRLGWVVMRCRASIDEPGSAPELARRYPQYVEHPPEGEVIVLAPEDILWWTWDGPDQGAGRLA